MNQPLVFLDIETTGLSPIDDDIIEVAAVKAEEGQIIDRFVCLIKPKRKLPAQIVSLTGITDEMLSDAPSQEVVLKELISFIGSLPVVGHNVSFDLSFITKKSGCLLDNPVLDTMDFLHALLPTAGSYSLSRAAKTLGIHVAEAHRALADAETACALYFKCLEILKTLNRDVLTKYFELCIGRDWPFAGVIASNAERALLNFPTDKQDVPYAFMKGEGEKQESLFDVAEKNTAEGKGYPVSELSFSNLAEILGEKGPFSESSAQYSFRQGQADMLEAVVQGFLNSRHVVIEAGTGTGKSLAYLIPAVRWSLEKEERVVITTHTINLQEQLWNKELPYLKQVTGWDFQSALVKGRNNYLCLRKWEYKLNKGGESSEELLFIMKILTWLTETLSGDKNELNLHALQQNEWNQVCSDNESCMGPACSWYHKYCFVMKARKKAESANILIVNHSLLLADIKMDNRVLPAFDYLIIDEAHHLEESATEQLGWTLGMNFLRGEILGLNRGFGSQQAPGLFNQLKQVFRNHPEFFEIDLQKNDAIINEGFETVKDICITIDEIGGFLQSWTRKHAGSGWDEGAISVRVCEHHRSLDEWNQFECICDNFISRTTSLSRQLNKLSGAFETLERDNQKAMWNYMKEIDSMLSFLNETNMNLKDFLAGSRDYVFWIEQGTAARLDTRIRCAPVSVNSLLHEHLFIPKRSVVLTSATISIEGNFEHFLNRIGLALCEKEEVTARSLISPFNYEKQSLLCVIRDLPEPGSAPDSDYIAEIVPVIDRVAGMFQGRTLVLFTSHKMLTETYRQLKPLLNDRGINLLGHKIDGGRTRLVNEFRAHNKSVLLGTSSFWEGIDLPGDILKCVVIARLPFAPPNSPVNEARIEELIELNKDPFRAYTLPQAVIKFKQGFGRLIRTEEDEGVVLVLDRRMAERSYGRKFLNSLPVSTHFRSDRAGVYEKISDWIDGERRDMDSLNIIENLADIEKYLNKAKRRRKHS